MYLKRLRKIIKEIRMILVRAEIWTDNLPNIRQRRYGLKQIARPHVSKHDVYPCVRNNWTLHTILCQIPPALPVKIRLPWFQSVCYPTNTLCTTQIFILQDAFPSEFCVPSLLRYSSIQGTYSAQRSVLDVANITVPRGLYNSWCFGFTVP